MYPIGFASSLPGSIRPENERDPPPEYATLHTPATITLMRAAIVLATLAVNARPGEVPWNSQKSCAAAEP